MAKMRNSRQEAIRWIVRNKSIRTQRDLVNELQAEGYSCTQATASRDIADMLDYSDPAQAANRYAEFLKARKGCDLVICLTHLGDKRSKTKGAQIDQDLVSGTTGVDIVIGGHAHSKIEEMQVWKNAAGEEVIYVTDGGWGLEVGRLDITF
jgi:5'-nucleotidase